MSYLRLQRPELLVVTDRQRAMTVDNPASGRTLGAVPDLDVDEVDAAVALAAQALPGWRSLPAGERAKILMRWHDAVGSHSADLATILVAEQGKPMAEAEGEIAYAMSFIQWFAEEGRRAYGDTIPSPHASRRIMTIRQGCGIVAAITPWNFPAAMVTRKVAPALAAGCTVILKPSELTPFTALALAQLAEESGLPPGVFQVVTGDAAAVGDVLTSDPRIAKFSFTGSTAIGKMLTAKCADTMKRVSMELGGNAPLIVFDDADLDLAIEGVMASKFRNSGQTCVCANRILVQDGIYDRFAQQLTERVRSLVVGDGLRGVTQQGPLISEAAVQKVEAHVEDALEKGARLLVGGSRHQAGDLFFSPTVIADATPAMRLATEETFGPVAPLFRFNTEKEAVELANETRSGLAAYVFSRDLDRFWRVSEVLEVGMVGFNTGLISSEVAPFGGVKESGVGREGGRAGLEEFLETKMICVGLSA